MARVPLVGLVLLGLALHPAAGRKLSQAGGAVPISNIELDIAGSINAFGDALFEQLRTEQGMMGEPSKSLIISPYSVAQALAMLVNGAEPDSESYNQLMTWLGADLPSEALDEFNQQFSDLTTILTQDDPNSGLRVDNANSAWLKRNLAWQAGYEEVLSAYFNATLGTITTAKAINDWVSEATNGKITEIVDGQAVRNAILLLINAVYFKGSWAKPFDKEATEPAPFYLADGEQMDTPMMFQSLDQGSVQTATLTAMVGDSEIKCAAIKLPYVGWTYSGVVAMPLGNFSQEADSGLFIEAEGSLVPYEEAIAACRQAVLGAVSPDNQWEMSDSPVLLYLPRFEIEFSASLNTALQALNITAPFVGGDLTLMAEGRRRGQPVKNLAVTEVLHKTYEKVDEAGTEAAAVTAIAVGTSAPIETNPPVELRFDRPFVFDIVHDASGLALFTGEIYEPEKAA